MYKIKNYNVFRAHFDDFFSSFFFSFFFQYWCWHIPVILSVKPCAAFAASPLPGPDLHVPRQQPADSTACGHQGWQTGGFQIPHQERGRSLVFQCHFLGGITSARCVTEWTDHRLPSCLEATEDRLVEVADGLYVLRNRPVIGQVMGLILVIVIFSNRWILSNGWNGYRILPLLPVFCLPHLSDLALHLFQSIHTHMHMCTCLIVRVHTQILCNPMLCLHS